MVACATIGRAPRRLTGVKSQVRTSVAILALIIVAAAGLLGRTNLSAGILGGVVGLALVGAFAWWSLRRGRHVAWAEARRLIGPGHAVVLWKPGCTYCERLLLVLRRDSRVTWVNVWQDADAQTTVCALNDGNEYTPTVLVGDQVLRNPTPGQVRAAIS